MNCRLDDSSLSHEGSGRARLQRTRERATIATPYEAETIHN